MHALRLESIQLTKRFGAFTALDHVSVQINPGTVHALLGENGAGKSTFVKCLVGYYKPDEGSVVIDQRERVIDSPIAARQLGIGMVYQHFTVIPGMTIAENLLLARNQLPAVVDWKTAMRELKAFMAKAPFQLPLDALPMDLSAGQKQKLEILKQLLLNPKLLILDEPTSVLTPQEADEVLGALRDRAHRGECSVLMITHKFREVHAYADDVSVLRQGKLVFSGSVAHSTSDQLATAMVGSSPVAKQADSASTGPIQNARNKSVVLEVRDASAMGDRGQWALNKLNFQVQAGQLLGIAGVSGNGQKELMQALTGQRKLTQGHIKVKDQVFHGSRAENKNLAVRSLPEEPLLNACVPGMSVTQNMSLRDFDNPAYCTWGWVKWAALKSNAVQWIKAYQVKTQGEHALIESLSGGNIQRTVLARELSFAADLLLVSNPSFGLDFAATAEVHAKLRQARASGTAILLISEDLDEILQLADQVAIISEGHIVHSVDARQANRQLLGSFMAGDVHVEIAA
jgi:ABC-type uncharacterized transport system ATPase subunit